MFYEALAVLGGLLLPLAFAPFGIPFLAVIALVLLFAAWSNATPGQAFRRGYLFGLGQFGLGVSWVYVSMHDYGGAGILEAAGLTALFALFLALYPGLAGWLAVRFCSRNGWFFRSSHLSPNKGPSSLSLWKRVRVRGKTAEESTRSPGPASLPLGFSSLQKSGAAWGPIAVFPAAWILLEWFRGWFLSGFPWLQIGYSQIDTPLAGLAPVFGVYGVGWALALLAGFLLAAPRWSGRRRWGALIAVTGLVGLSAGLGRIEWTRPAGESFKVALLQGNIAQDMKWQPEFQRATLQTYLALTREHWDARLIVWPETAVPAFYQQVRDTFLADLEAEAKTHNTDLLIGVPYYNAAEDRYYNAVAALGRTPGFYFKRHLVPFGEFLPLRPLLGWVLEILQIPLSDFASGNGGQPSLIAAGHPLSASICYEDIFGAESLAGLPQAAYLVNVTNDAWFGDSIAPHQHAQMARMRSLETGRWMLRATNTGVTAIIDPQGSVSAKAPLFQKLGLTGTIAPMQGSTPYIMWGDGPVVAGALGLLGYLAWRRYRPAAKPLPGKREIEP